MKKFAALLCALFFAGASAFVPPAQKAFVANPRSTLSFTAPLEPQLPAALQRQRKSMASVQTMGLFGLGPLEIGVILVAAAFLLGPQKLAELGKDAGKIAGELKEVPKEFQKGMAEGEIEAAKMKKEIMGEDAEVVKDTDEAKK
jgi:sec-independent protein translocase protein TatA